MYLFCVLREDQSDPPVPLLVAELMSKHLLACVCVCVLCASLLSCVEPLQYSSSQLQSCQCGHRNPAFSDSHEHIHEY